jgi:acetylornithine deacetylase/succinyl-diaminopimelate desuccinylase-like protein
MKNSDIKILKEFLEIKSVSAQKEFEPEMEKARYFLLNLFTKMGFSTKIIKGNVHDLVFAEKIVNPKAPTVLIYGHYDVQPPDPIAEWKTPPFKPVVRGENIYGRGTSDDKGQIMANIIAGKKLINKFKGQPPINLKYIIEGEEEIGSPSVAVTAKKYAKNLLVCDYLLVSDSEMISENQSTIDISLRGLTYMEIVLEAAKHDLHSGSYGGIAENPAVILSRIIAKLKNNKGKVLIPGFYDDVIKPSASEARDFAKIKVTKKSLTREGEFYLIGGGEPEYSLNDRRWTRPTLDVNGITSGYQGEGSKTIIPAKASAKISMRLVPNQNPDKIAKLFTAYVKKLVPKGLKLAFINHSGSFPYKAPTKDPVFDLAKRCLTKSFGDKAVFDGVGGSIGFVPIMATALKVPCLLIGFGLPGDNIHAPNEHIAISGYLNGINAICELLTEIPKIYAK